MTILDFLKKHKIPIAIVVVVLILLVVYVVATQSHAGDPPHVTGQKLSDSVQKNSDDTVKTLDAINSQVSKKAVDSQDKEQVVSTLKLATDKVVSNVLDKSQKDAAKVIDTNLDTQTKSKAVAAIINNGTDTATKISQTRDEISNDIRDSPDSETTAAVVSNKLKMLSTDVKQSGASTSQVVKSIVSSGAVVGSTYTEYALDYPSQGDLVGPVCTNMNSSGSTLEQCKAVCDANPDCLGLEEWGIGQSWHGIAMKGVNNVSDGPITTPSPTQSGTKLHWKGPPAIPIGYHP